jgi:hypothetical protein
MNDAAYSTFCGSLANIGLLNLMYSLAYIRNALSLVQLLLYISGSGILTLT